MRSHAQSTDVIAQVFDQTVSQWTEQESKQEALLRLLCHYLIYIGKPTSLLESSSEEKTMLEKWRYQWNKPAAFTWNSNEGLQMHYRIEPPAHWIVSSSEDESLNSIDVDLSEFDDVAMFMEDGDLVKCTSCGTLWTDLDAAGHCLICQSPEYQDEGFTQLLSFESDFDPSIDAIFNMSLGAGIDTTVGDSGQALLTDSAAIEASQVEQDTIDQSLNLRFEENYQLEQSFEIAGPF